MDHAIRRKAVAGIFSTRFHYAGECQLELRDGLRCQQLMPWGADSVGLHNLLGLDLVESQGKSAAGATCVCKAQLRQHLGHGGLCLGATIETLEEIEY